MENDAPEMSLSYLLPCGACYSTTSPWEIISQISIRQHKLKKNSDGAGSVVVSSVVFHLLWASYYCSGLLAGLA